MDTESLVCKTCKEPFTCTKLHRVRRGHKCPGCVHATIKGWKAANKAQVRKTTRAWCAKNPQRVRDKANRRYHRLASWLTAQKLAPCLDCGISYPPHVMDFDHVRGVKLSSVANMLSRDATKKRAADEIAKCELVCANCHRERTYRRREANKNNGRVTLQSSRGAATGI